MQQAQLGLDLFRPAPVSEADEGAFTLRPYQRDAISALETYWIAGGKRALIALPTGTGKTVLFAAAIGRNLDAQRALVIAHREELLDQAKEKIAASNPGLSVAVEQADRRAGDADVVVASIQTLVSGRVARYQQFPPDEVGLIIVDEAHHSPARTYMQTLAYYGLAPDPALFTDTAKKGRRSAIDGFCAAPNAPLLLGVTATPSRSDKVGMEAVFDEIVYARNIREMIDEGWLCPIRGVRVETGVSLDGVATRLGDFVEGQLEQAVNNEERNALIVGAYHDHAPGRQSIVFCAGVDHAQSLAELFQQAGVKAAWVSGATPSSERRAIIADYRAGRVRVITNCAVLTEGFDAPETDCIIMARPTKSSTLYTQMLGRGTRIAERKADLVVIDVVDAYARAGVANVNALFGLPPRFKLDEEDSVSDQVKRFEQEMEFWQAPFDAFNEAQNWKDVKRIAEEIDPLRAAETDPLLKHTAKYSWLTAPWGYYLAMPEGTLGVVVNLLGQGIVRWKPRNDRPQEVGRHEDAETAIRAAEAWVDSQDNGEGRSLIARNARWHKDEPSDKQLKYARFLGVRVPEGATKGHVKALIDRALMQKEWRNAL